MVPSASTSKISSFPRAQSNQFVSFSLSNEIFRGAKTYSEVFKGFAYDEYHFDKMDELDYISRTTGEGHY